MSYYSRRSPTGFDFDYDDSLPDPLDGETMHDHIDGYCIVDKPENIAIVGTYSNKCARKNALLCCLEEIGDLLDDVAQHDVTIRHTMKSTCNHPVTMIMSNTTFSP